jgi:hypothetical protein
VIPFHAGLRFELPLQLPDSPAACDGFDTGRCPRTEGDHPTRQVDRAMTDPQQAPEQQQHAGGTASATHGLYCHAGGPGRNKGGVVGALLFLCHREPPKSEE